LAKRPAIAACSSLGGRLCPPIAICRGHGGLFHSCASRQSLHKTAARRSHGRNTFLFSVGLVVACVANAQVTVVRPPDVFYSGGQYPGGSPLSWGYPLPCANHMCESFADSMSQVVATLNRHQSLIASSYDFGTRVISYEPDPRPPVREGPRSSPWSCVRLGNVALEQYCRGTGGAGGYYTFSDYGRLPDWYGLGTWWLGEHVDCLPSTSHPIGTGSDWLPIWSGASIVGCKKVVDTPPSPATCGTYGNPIDPSSSAKIQREVDYQSPISGGLTLDRIWNSNTQKWRSAYEQSLQTAASGNGSGEYCEFVWNRLTGTVKYVCATETTRTNELQLLRADGSAIGFSASLPYAPLDAQHRNYALKWIGFGWAVQTPANTLEVYDGSGRLLNISDQLGRTKFFSYRLTSGAWYPAGSPACKVVSSSASNQVQCITEWTGRQLNFRYDVSGNVAGFVDPAKSEIQYHYNGPTALLPDGFTSLYPTGAPLWQLITSVIYPGGASRTYHFNEAVLAPQSTKRLALTGVTDERGQRIGTYAYDAKGRATITEAAGGTNRYSFDYSALDSAGRTHPGSAALPIAITRPNGASHSETYQRVGPYAKKIAASQPAGSGCGPASSQMTYDAQANLTSRADFNGFKTCYAYDLSRNLETKRVEGLSSSADCTFGLSSPPAGARLISTQWHPDWRLETRIAEPKKLTTIVYNGQGATCAPDTVLVDGKPPAVVCSRTEQATTDESGAAGFATTVTGTARTWSYTYTTYGRVLTATDPNGAVTSYSYHPDNDANLGRRGNVATITNAVGHVTRITAYNAHGQPTRIIDPNNLITDLTYDLRMRLTRRKVGNESTSFVYDAAGQFTRVTLPDGARLTYTYDAAHRLTAIADHKGNKVAYTLDAMGNRINEKLTDPGGVLVRNIQRSIDALNRVQQVTGASSQ
jgi:YD repeat-containing protein